MDENQTINPPDIERGGDGSSDVALLKAISANAECARVLARIATGGDPAELMAGLIPKDDATSESGQEAEVAPETEVVMYQSPAARTDTEPDDSFPSFLGLEKEDFWDF